MLGEPGSCVSQQPPASSTISGSHWPPAHSAAALSSGHTGLWCCHQHSRIHLARNACQRNPPGRRKLFTNDHSIRASVGMPMLDSSARGIWLAISESHIRE